MCDQRMLTVSPHAYFIIQVASNWVKVALKLLTPPPEYAMQMLTLLVIFESVAFHEEISCTTRTLYSMDQIHLIIISSNCIHFLK